MATAIPVKYYNTYVLKKINRQTGPSRTEYDWYIEESRIRGGYNNVQTGLAPRAFLASDENTQQLLANSIIYSGVVNSRTGVNQTNVFPSGQDITRTVDPSKGSIQKLYAEDTNLTIFQERKVNRALIDKDAIYTQEGLPVQTTSNVVIGAIQPYAGEFGIAKNPESFAVYGYRKYFTDAAQGSVLRLSRDGITEISNYGMYDFFRDQFGILEAGKAIGGYDIYNKAYVLALQTSTSGSPITVTFDEQVLGWTSTLSYIPRQMFSIQNNFFSTKNGSLYKHYVEFNNSGGVLPRANFYGVQYDSTVTSILNTNPSLVKTFKTVNYEGNFNWSMESFVTNEDSANPIAVYNLPTTLANMESSLFKNEFKRKEDKYFANLINTSAATGGEVIYGRSISGVKGFFATVKLRATNTASSGTNELFALSSNYSESSY